MLKAGSKRRRTKQECRESRERDELRKSELSAKISSMENMRRELEAQKARADGNQGAHEVIQDMINKGLVHVDENGAFQYQ